MAAHEHPDRQHGEGPPVTVSPCPRPDKVAHRSREKAVAHMRHLKRQGETDLNVYQCCDHWHVGHSAIPLRRRVRRALSRRSW